MAVKWSKMTEERPLHSLLFLP